MALPFMKLGTLALRTLSKPIATRLKKRAAVNPKFRTAIMAIAQANHRFTTRIQRRIYARDTDVQIRPLDEERAVQVAGDLIGELFVFTVAGAVVIFEVQRSARSEAKKEEARKNEIEIMRQRDENLAKQMELLEQKLVELEKAVRAKSLADSQTKEVKQEKPSP
ncbi:hypothetical protein OSB04_001925 [Centaurea solstitialis]|uniref:OPA3-like protein n=1 Tax=Centaurea solstitialis TaxID=347529 RepID=A0AA38TTQ4_9ASTR|nr:hypothetical protein OSB04_001925 [Centaurea solstitialis]